LTVTRGSDAGPTVAVRWVKVFKDELGDWYPEEHLPKNVLVPKAASTEVEHDTFWPDGQEKYLHRIDRDGKRWYLRPSKYNEEEFVKMLRRHREKRSQKESSAQG
jgi:hypothetical protein